MRLRWDFPSNWNGPEPHVMNERDLFLSALEIEGSAARKAHLQAACAGNVELLARVESLLASHEDHPEFLAIPAVEQLVDRLAEGAAVADGNGQGASGVEAPASHR